MQTAQFPFQEIADPLLVSGGVRLFVLRIDLSHPQISGNKIFKLRYHIAEAKEKKQDTLLTFGGAFSNHIAATAAAGREHRLQTIGIIRGEQVENPTLKLAAENGMLLDFVSRELYRDKNALYDYAQQKYGNDLHLIPEGAADETGIKGCLEIRQHIPIPFDTICAPAGTGTTLTGIILSLKGAERALGFQVLKGENYLENEVSTWLKKLKSEVSHWAMNDDYHFGGYAKDDQLLQNFIGSFSEKHNIPLDRVYTGKMMYGIFDLLKKGYFKKGAVIVALHTGGLQGGSTSTLIYR
jgi:1-aminocyclopropane-1-carboxylate deaminase